MQKKNRDLKIFTCIFCVLLILVCVPLMIIAATTQYPASIKDNFKPMYVPMFILGFLILFAIYFLVESLIPLLKDKQGNRKKEEKFQFISSKGLFILIATVLYGAAWQVVGFLLSTTLFFAIAVKRLESERSWKEVIICSVLFTIVIYIVFVTIFKVPFPEPLLDKLF